MLHDASKVAEKASIGKGGFQQFIELNSWSHLRVGADGGNADPVQEVCHFLALSHID